MKVYVVFTYIKLTLVFSNTVDNILIMYTLLRQCSERIVDYTKRKIFIKISLYLQVLVAQPVRIAFLGKDVVRAMFVVSIAIPYVYEVFAYNQTSYT